MDKPSISIIYNLFKNVHLIIFGGIPTWHLPFFQMLGWLLSHMKSSVDFLVLRGQRDGEQWWQWRDGNCRDWMSVVFPVWTVAKESTGEEHGLKDTGCTQAGIRGLQKDSGLHQEIQGLCNIRDWAMSGEQRGITRNKMETVWLKPRKGSSLVGWLGFVPLSLLLNVEANRHKGRDLLLLGISLLLQSCQGAVV